MIGRRVVLLLGVLALLTVGATACAPSTFATRNTGTHPLTSSPASRSPTDPASVTSPPTPTPSRAANRPSNIAAPVCDPNGMHLSLGPRVSPATGEHGVIVEITNTTAATCSLVGYPHVTLLNAKGQPMGFTYADGHSQYVTANPPILVTIPARAHAYLLIAKYRCDLGEVAVATRAQITLPQTHTAVSLALSANSGVMSLTYCSGGPRDPGQRVALSPITRLP